MRFFALLGVLLMPFMAFAQEAAGPDMVEMIIQYLKSSLPGAFMLVFVGMGALVTLGTIYIQMTPTKDDDQWLQKMENHSVWGIFFRIFRAFSPIQRKDK